MVTNSARTAPSRPFDAAQLGTWLRPAAGGGARAQRGPAPLVGGFFIDGDCQLLYTTPCSRRLVPESIT